MGPKPGARTLCWARSGGWCQRRRGNADATAPPPGPPGGRFLISLGRSSTVELRSPKPMVEGSIPSVPAKPLSTGKKGLHIVNCTVGNVSAAGGPHALTPGSPLRHGRPGGQAPGPLAHRRKSACVASRRCGVQVPGGARMAMPDRLTGRTAGPEPVNLGSNPCPAAVRPKSQYATLAQQAERPTCNGQVTRSTRVGGSQGSGTDPASDGRGKDNAGRSPSRPPTASRDRSVNG
jgi:hypothetical protein